MKTTHRLLTTIAVAGWGMAAEAADISRDAVAVLRQAGLTEVNRCWVCRDEARLLRQLDRLDDLRGEFRRTRQRWLDLAKEQAELRAQIAKSNERVQQLDDEISAAGADAFRWSPLKERRRALAQKMHQQRRELWKRLDGLNEQSVFSKSAKRYADARIRLEATNIALRFAIERSGSWYDSMDASIGEAIEVLAAEGGERVRLGPARDYRVLLPQRLAPLAKLLADARLPIYRSAGRFRFPVILNDSAPATMIVVDDSPLSLAPTSLLAAAGVEVPDEAPRRTIDIDGRRIEGRVVSVPTLKLGRHALGPIEFLAVDPEADNMGPCLAGSALERFELRWDDERLELEVRAR